MILGCAQELAIASSCCFGGARSTWHIGVPHRTLQFDFQRSNDVPRDTSLVLDDPSIVSLPPPSMHRTEAPPVQSRSVARVIAIANQKGGVGKTTTAVNLAASLAVAEKRTLLIDGDPQGNATSGVGIERDGIAHTTYHVLLGEATIADARIREVQFRHLDVLPATADLAGAEVELVDATDREQRMRNAIAQVQDDYDYVLIDCPPSLGLITLNMLAAADALLIPLQCEYYALEGLSQLLNTVHLIQHSVNPTLAISGVLLTMYDARLNLSRQVAAEAREYFGGQVFETVVPRNVRLAEAPSFGKPIVLYDVQSIGAQAYMAAAHELIIRDTAAAAAAAAAAPAKTTATPASASAKADR